MSVCWLWKATSNHEANRFWLFCSVFSPPKPVQNRRGSNIDSRERDQLVGSVTSAAGVIRLGARITRGEMKDNVAVIVSLPHCAHCAPALAVSYNF